MRRSLTLGAVVALLMLPIAAPVSAAPPSNDDRGSATTIGALPFSDSVDTSEATPQDSDPPCVGDETTNPTVWYSFTPAANGRYMASTSGSDYDTTLLVAAVTGGGLDIKGCSDDFDGVSSAVSWYARAGQEYLIMAGACCGAQGGDLEFSLRRVPRKIKVSISIASAGVVTGLGKAVIHGRVECQHGAGAYAWGRAEVRQVVRGFYIRGSQERRLRCNQSWRLRIRGDIGRFRAGRLAVQASATGCNASSCDSDSEYRIVRLRQPD